MTKSRVSCPPDKLLFQIMNQLINTNDQLINPPKSKPTSHILKVEGQLVEFSCRERKATIDAQGTKRIVDNVENAVEVIEYDFTVALVYASV